MQCLARRCIPRQRPRPASTESHETEPTIEDERQLLIVDSARAGSVAIPLEVVTRLEEFPRDSIERVGHREVVRYRNAVLPLMRLAATWATVARARPSRTCCQVSSTRHEDAVSPCWSTEIVDIVSAAQPSASDIDDIGLVGSAVLRDRVTELLDVRAAIMAADPAFYAGEDADDLVPLQLNETEDQYSWVSR